MLDVIEGKRIFPIKKIEEKITKVFDKLEKQRIVCRQNFWCCQTCGSHNLIQSYDKNLNYDGYCFYHNQDYDDLKKANYTYLSYGGFRDEDMISIGLKIVKAFKKEGIQVFWDGSPNTRIRIEF